MGTKQRRPAQLVSANWVGGMSQQDDDQPNLSSIGDVLLLFKILRKFDVKVQLVRLLTKSSVKTNTFITL